MPANANPFVVELLSWHGHDSGGVRVPFSQRGGNPIRDQRGDAIVIETNLVRRLRSLARAIARGEDVPRWIFLVGGPGNGKSEAVDQFVRALDNELGCAGRLTDILRRQLPPRELVPWLLEVSAEVAREAGLPPAFRDRVGHLMIVQDASAGGEPGRDAADHLLDFLLDLLTWPGDPVPVVACCVNRGLLARSLRRAHEGQVASEVVELLKSIVRATALGRDALSAHRPSCWPLELPSGIDSLAKVKVACWPMDVESLLLPSASGGVLDSPVGQVVLHAVREDEWEPRGRCGDCDSGEMCPFRANAAWLRNDRERENLLKVLRRAELATGQRWNFRDTFSLVAELLVGEWVDFGSSCHPCEWVHGKARQAQEDDPAVSFPVLVELVQRLYPLAMFPGLPTVGLAPEVAKAAGERGFRATLSVASVLASGDARAAATTHIRRFIGNVVAPRLDPALLSPRDSSHPLGRLEDAYSQAVRLGNHGWPSPVEKTPIEERLFCLLEAAEREWDLLQRDHFQALLALRFLRATGSCLAKRLVGVRLGYHADEEYLQEYERAMRNPEVLSELVGALRLLLGGDGFECNALGSFGQPQPREDWVVRLRGKTISLEPISPAPSPTGEDNLPVHDFPFITVAERSIPLTFDLYVALRLCELGCTSGSLPSSVRAIMDRIRYLYAGRLSRDEKAFVTGNAEFDVRGLQKIVIKHPGGLPTFQRGSGPCR